MTNKDPRYPGFAWLNPALTVRDSQKAIDFYRDVIGFDLVNSITDDSNVIVHTEMKYHDATIMFSPEMPDNENLIAPVSRNATSFVNLYIYVDNVDEIFQKAIAHGGKAITEPEDAYWGDRYASFSDPDGYVWSVAKNFGECDPNLKPA